MTPFGYRVIGFGAFAAAAGAGGGGTTLSFGSEAVFNSSSSPDQGRVEYDPNNANKFVQVYRDRGNSEYGTAIVGTVSGTTITYGSEYVFNSGSSGVKDLSFDPNDSDKFVVAYKDASNSNYGTAIVGTIDGTAISFGTAAVFSEGWPTQLSMSVDPNNTGKFVVAYYDMDNSGYGTAIVGTVDGTDITYGSEYIFNSSTTAHPSISFDPNDSDKFVVAYKAAPANGTAVVGTISGTAISFGTVAEFHDWETLYASMSYVTVAFDPNTAGKFVVAYMDGNIANYGTGLVGTVSGTTISYGSKYTYTATAGAIYNHVGFDPNTAGKFVIVYRDGGNSDYGTACVGTIDGTVITFVSEVVFASSAVEETSISFDPNTSGNFVISYKDGGNSDYGTAIIGQLA